VVVEAFKVRSKVGKLAEGPGRCSNRIEQLFNIHFLDPNIYYISELPSDPHLSDILSIGGFAFLITLGATLYPALKASRTQPAEALRYE
jgi:lipoprotein-releasing system permease protein